MKRWSAAVLLVAIACAVRCTCRGTPREPVRIATFNIEDFPQSRRQVDGAFAEMRDLHASIIAVQEIGDPELFAREARQRFGEQWQFAHVDTRPIGERRPGHHNGVLFDGATWKLLDMRVHDGTRLADGRHKPVLDVRLQSKVASSSVLARNAIVHVLVIHFKSGTEGRPVRAAQYRALRAILLDVERAKEPIIVEGDFNATEVGDRDDLALLARDTNMVWASEPLACTAFWRREDGCPRSRLDHVLTWRSPTTVEVAGACAREGCDWQPSCPVYAHEVSDHCPVIVTF